MERVTGIGGIFFKSDDPKALYEWYERHLGIKRDPDGSGVSFRWAGTGMTVWSIFPRTSEYLGPDPAPLMINYRVADLDALLEVLGKEGVWIDDKRDESYGKFAWIRDCDGNRIELWEPPPGD
jgi:catechol 2,3-dioxygenase-like lactoylglutathione lyase family enzyme